MSPIADGVSQTSAFAAPVIANDATAATAAAPNNLVVKDMCILRNVYLMYLNRYSSCQIIILTTTWLYAVHDDVIIPKWAKITSV